MIGSRMINVCLFEDEENKKIEPVTYLKPAYSLLLGIDTLFDKVNRYFGWGNISLHCREVLKPLVKKAYPNIIVNNINTGSPCLFLNSRLVMTSELAEFLLANKGQYDHLYLYKGNIAAAYLKGGNLSIIKKALDEGCPNTEILFAKLRPKCVAKELDDIVMIQTLPDLIEQNTSILEKDFEYYNQPGIIKGEMAPFASLYNENNIYIGRNTNIEDFVTLDATKGPIYIEEDVVIQAGSRLEGPLFIGKGSHVLGARVRSSSIGAYSKVGGEVSMTIIQGYSNKAHEGFLGHSFVGEWVNMGAGTTTSNLKSTYGSARFKVGGGDQEASDIFLGTVFGDHVKTGIGTLLNCGTVLGYGSVVFNSKVHDTSLNPFTWGEAGDYQQVKIEKFLETASKVMARRGKVLTDDEHAVIEQLYKKVSTSQ